MNTTLARFTPHPLLPGGNLQTLAAAIAPAPRVKYRAVRRFVELPDGDKLVLHDDRPHGWRPGGKTALLIHGLGGSHASAYLVRIAQKLNAEQVRTFRLDLRGWGAGEPHARGATHLGRWDDVRASLQKIAELCPESPTEAVGFSIGGSLALNAAGRLGPAECGNLSGVLAVCPPVDLNAVDASFSRGAGRVYSRYLAGLMWRHIQRRLRSMPNPPKVNLPRRPRHIRELDDLITAPYHGFRDAEHYYQEVSAADYLSEIRVPTRIIAAADDPVIPLGALLETPRSDAVDILVAKSGGHLGFYGRGANDPDANWIDWRTVEWVTRSA